MTSRAGGKTPESYYEYIAKLYALHMGLVMYRIMVDFKPDKLSNEKR